MQRHIRNYFEATGYDQTSFIPCELCRAKSVDIHHIRPRSRFGRSRKTERDSYANLAALCRDCHIKAHGKDSRRFEEMLIEIAQSRNQIM